ncbi:hypothetical protein BTW00_12500 [Psychrobacter sp. C 20.9]|uniref:hypothetical protein n=1 Tax=Psychrobacter sp. C 20.9 TaxID=1926477 RepID=UPI000946AA62|nr:hypothetical protein [Psychrobacter sp. C 20.9]OLF34655.1 hypothetical protein BTW00_12500 [Psychrobacter sp. C 20.9]
MNIKYLWKYDDVDLVPAIDLKSNSNGFKGLIVNFLKNDEGLGLEYLRKWIAEGFIEIEKVRLGELDFYDMWGQAWGAEVSPDNVLIYWGYDDNIGEEDMSFECFYTIVKNWNSFLNSEPSLYNVIEFELN